MADFRYSANLVIPTQSEAKDAGIAQEITYVYNALRSLAAHLDSVTGALSPLKTDWPQLSPTDTIVGGGGYKAYVKAGAAISYGMMVNLYNLDSTHVQAKPAIASTAAGAAIGFCLVPEGVAAGEFGEFICGPGLNYGISGLVPGTWYYLSSSSAGLVTNVAPVGVGQIRQNCGLAITNSALLVGSLNNWTQL